MAYLQTLREFRPGRAWARLRTRLPVACVLCGTRTPGGLCVHCRRAVTASKTSGAPRCGRCDVLLAELRNEYGCAAGWGERAGASGRGSPEDAVRPDMEIDDVGPGVQPTAMTQDAPKAGLQCPDCYGLLPACDRVVAAFDYQWPGDLLIHRIKSHGQFGCAPILAELIADRMPVDFVRDVTVTAIPASRRSLIQRGYNPAAEIGRMLARRLDLPWRSELLRRVQEGSHQKQLSRNERWEHVAKRYDSPAVLSGENILVVDDVMTTGATLHNVAAVLKARGAAKVWGAVAARTPAITPASKTDQGDVATVGKVSLGER